MSIRPNPVEALVTLPRLPDPADRSAHWRQAIAALGRRMRVSGPPPLDEILPEQLVASARTALATGLADDVDWIDPRAAAVALYELTTALPSGTERREFGRRVFARIYEGTAAVFSAVATRMALAGGKPLETPTMRARVHLALDSSVGSTVHADPLALALISRRPLFRQWCAVPSTGALPMRRLAALLLERAAREAVRKAQEGDPYPTTLFADDEVAAVHARLMADREPLVWRHAAITRGLLAAVESGTRGEIEMALDPNLSPTEWRRAAVSLTTLIAYDPGTALKQCRQLIKSDIAESDPGMQAVMLWALPRVFEVEPDAAEELLETIAASRRPDVAENTAALLREIASQDFGQAAAAILENALSKNTDDEAMLVIFQGALGKPDDAAKDTGVYGNVRRALVAYETIGARAAFDGANEALAAAHRVMDGIEALSSHGALVDPDLIGLLVDLDTSVLERSRLGDLLLLGRRPGDTDTSIPEMERLYDRLGVWLVGREETTGDEAWSRASSQARRRRLRALLHLMDVEAIGDGEDDPAGRVLARARRAIRVLLDRIAEGPDAGVHRILCATLARSFDAAVREGFADPSDVFLVAAQQIFGSESVLAVSEASTTPEVSGALKAYSDFLQRASRQTMESIVEGSFDAATITKEFQPGEELDVARRLVRLSQGIGTGGSYRGEALRQVVLAMGRALEGVAMARGLTELVDAGGGGPNPLGDLESSIDKYRKLALGAGRRLADDDSSNIDVVADVARLSALVERAVGSGVPANAEQFAMAVGEMTAELPDPMSAAIAHVLGRVVTLPTEAEVDDEYAIPLAQPRTALPDWLLPRRVIGGFYVVRSLGSGGAASVFVARRVEDRQDSSAEPYALKVPQYDPSTARSLSEQEFLDMFREEAGALLSLPKHENLANFVTFDLAAKPKPILVMELIKGMALDRVIRNRSLTADRAFVFLDGILQGLEAMHGAGVGHLDLKPSNVILRDSACPVLVDFGLSGRHLRPGCGTLEYTAPEVLGIVQEGHQATPMAADLYAFGCLAFEVLMGEFLFDAADETQIISLHLAHDGWPSKLAELGNSDATVDLATVLAACLRHDPRNRPNATETREALRRAAERHSQAPWPVSPHRFAEATA